jgi:hypothetical protein
LSSTLSKASCDVFEFTFCSLIASIGFTYPTSRFPYESTPFPQILLQALIFDRKRLKIKGRNVISECLKRAITTPISATAPLGIRATPPQSCGSIDLKIAYPIPPNIIMSTSCRMLKLRKILSSFSICTGILYCTRKKF